MAVQKYILKKTHQEVVVKIYGDAVGGTTTLDLQTDLLHDGQELSGLVAQTVNLVSANWTGAAGSTATITRDGQTIIPIVGDSPQRLDFAGEGYVDTVNNTADFSITTSGGELVIYMVLRKVAGYVPKVETAVFGALDDVNQVGV